MKNINDYADQILKDLNRNYCIEVSAKSYKMYYDMIESKIEIKEDVENYIERVYEKMMNK